MARAFTPVSWVTRWFVRSVATLAVTAFTALALAVGAGSVAPPAAAISVAPPAAEAVRPATVTLSESAARDLASSDATTTAPEPPRPQADAIDRTGVIAMAPLWRPAGIVPAGPIGERAPPLR